MRTVAIVQARMTSTRLPGKVIMDVAGQTILERVIRRTRRFREIEDVIVATSDLASDDPVVDECRRLSAPVFRGDESDVLTRFLQAAEAFDIDVAVRITADCPLIDPDVSDHIVRLFKAAAPPVDYASNKIPQSYPRGLDTEVFTVDALRRAQAAATEPYERAHVTIHMYEHPENFKLLSVTSDVDRADWRWTVDAPEDLTFVREVYRHLGGDGQFSWLDVVQLLTDRPHLRNINAAIVQKAVREG